ncbi:hypothetical protein AX17_006270 [Amanita inopinata Kibby_2008]|nr:hypothetical protein AX17_006270 [Amanita inopinata Kibby_2008]
MATGKRKHVQKAEGLEGTDEDLQNLDDRKRICLAVLCHNNHFGCAYYEPQRCTIYALEDTEETSHFDATRTLLEQAGAAIVITSSSSDDNFIDMVREYMEAIGGFFQIRPRKDFMPGRGRDRLLSLNLFSELPEENMESASPPNDIENYNSRERNAYDFMRRQRATGDDPAQSRWNAMIRLSNFASVESSPLCMASIGALIDHLVRERAVGDLDEDGISGLEVNDIEIISPNEAMQINADALFSLQIFENESHASVHSDKTKEGLSLFGILNQTKTTLGRSLLRTWLLRPSLSLTTIKARHDAVECFLRPENHVAAGVMHTHLKGIRNMPRILSIMKSGRANTSDWQGLVKFTFHTAMLHDALHELHQTAHVHIVKELIAVLDIPKFRNIGVQVNGIIDWEESVHAGRVCVRQHVDEELDSRKHTYYGIDSVLSSVAEHICYSTPQLYASSLNVVYFPQLGFLICIPMSDGWQTEGIPNLDGWSFQTSSAHAYFKSQEMRDLDTHIGDLHSSIVDREIEIVQELLAEVLPSCEAINQACKVCAELDCLLSFAAASRAYNYRRPVMVDDNVIDIKEGRHPLQEQVVDTFVPNDFRITGGIGFAVPQDAPQVDEWKSIMLLTGANACGKSVYLKQIALIQFMGQIGCFVPAESATLGVVDKIFTRVSTRESVSKIQSAFMIDLNQVSYALRNCTGHSLILLDEFGKGTLPTDGTGLFCGVLMHLLQRGVNCPKVIAATHFHDVFQHGLLDPCSVPIAFRHMQIMFTSSTGSVLTDDEMASNDGYFAIRPGEKITYLYRVAEGLSLESHAAKCAEIFGIPSRVVQRAQYVSRLISTHELGKLLDEGMTEKEQLDLEDAEDVCRRFLSWDLEDNRVLVKGGVKVKLAEVLGRNLDQS